MHYVILHMGKGGSGPPGPPPPPPPKSAPDIYTHTYKYIYTHYTTTLHVPIRTIVS